MNLLLSNVPHLTFGVGDLVHDISNFSGPTLKLVGANGLVVNLPVSGMELTYTDIYYL